MKHGGSQEDGVSTARIAGTMTRYYLLENFHRSLLSMFETVVLRRHANDGQMIDAGLLAETLLFYDNVHIVADAGTLSALTNQTGTDSVIRLLEAHHIKLTCVIGLHCTMSQTENGVPVNRFVCVAIGGTEKKN
jgi:hypothetical protein